MQLQDLPSDVQAQMHPAFPRLQPLLRVFVEDPRSSMYTDSVAAGMYLVGAFVSRAALTQLLHQAVKRGHLERQGRGRYSITSLGREFLRDIGT